MEFYKSIGSIGSLNNINSYSLSDKLRNISVEKINSIKPDEVLKNNDKGDREPINKIKVKKAHKKKTSDITNLILDDIQGSIAKTFGVRSSSRDNHFPVSQSMSSLPSLNMNIDRELSIELNRIKNNDQKLKKSLDIIPEKIENKEKVNKEINSTILIKDTNSLLGSMGMLNFNSSLMSAQRYNSTDKLKNDLQNEAATGGTIYITGSDFRKSMNVNYGTKPTESKHIKEKLIEEIRKEVLDKFVENSGKSKFYCPYCDHCNTDNDEVEVVKYVNAIKSTKNELSRNFDFIIQSGIMKDNNLDLFNVSENRSKSDEEFLKNFPQQTNTKLIYQVISRFLDALIEKKIDFKEFCGPELLKKIDNTLLLEGKSFEDIKSEVVFDKEIERLFDKESKKIIKTVAFSKYRIKKRIHEAAKKRKHVER